MCILHYRQSIWFWLVDVMCGKVATNGISQSIFSKSSATRLNFGERGDNWEIKELKLPAVKTGLVFIFSIYVCLYYPILHTVINWLHGISAKITNFSMQYRVKQMSLGRPVLLTLSGVCNCSSSCNQSYSIHRLRSSPTWICFTCLGSFPCLLD